MWNKKKDNDQIEEVIEAIFNEKCNRMQSDIQNKILHSKDEVRETVHYEVQNMLSDIKNILTMQDEQLEKVTDELKNIIWNEQLELKKQQEQNARLERILTYYHKQDMQMFWQEYRRDGETTEDAQKRFFLSLPKARGYERNLQILESILLKKLNEICEEHHLRYWLDSGTLLGAVRHQGFIPWDDDIETGMVREDIDKLKEILKDNEEYCVTEKYDAWGQCKQIRFCFKNSDLPVFLDIFPHDWTTKATAEVWDTFKQTRKELIEEISDESNPLIKEFRAVGCVDVESEMGQQIKKIFDKYYNRLWKTNILCEEEVALGCLYSFDTWSYCDHSNMVAKELLFPLRKMEFEEIDCNVPKESIYLLKQLYGEDFYTLPCGEPHFSHADWKRNEQLLEDEVRKRTK